MGNFVEEIPVLNQDDDLEVRVICERSNNEWIIKKLRVMRLNTLCKIPRITEYDNYLFIREDSNCDTFIPIFKQMNHKAGKFVLAGVELKHNIMELSEPLRIGGQIPWGVCKSAFPSWRVTGAWQGEYSNGNAFEGPLIGKNNEPYFPTMRDAESWFLYGYLIETSKTIPAIDITIDDYSAYFSGIEIEGSNYHITCGGKRLKECNLQLFTSQLQMETVLADNDITFTIIGRPNKISFVLSSDGDWLDRRDVNLEGLGHFLPDDVNFAFRDNVLATKELITRHGESTVLEFKEKIDEGRQEKDRLLQSIVAFANTNGGQILLGVSDQGEIVGVEKEGTKEKIQDKIENFITSVPSVEYGWVEIEGKNILIIKVDEGKEKPYALDVHSNKPIFYVRRDGSNKLAKPEDIRKMFS